MQLNEGMSIWTFVHEHYAMGHGIKLTKGRPKNEARVGPCLEEIQQWKVWDCVAPLFELFSTTWGNLLLWRGHSDQCNSLWGFFVFSCIGRSCWLHRGQRNYHVRTKFGYYLYYSLDRNCWLLSLNSCWHSDRAARLYWCLFIHGAKCYAYLHIYFDRWISYHCWPSH